MKSISISALFIFLLIPCLSSHPDCSSLDTGSVSNNPIYREADCASKCGLCFKGGCGTPCDENGKPEGCSDRGGEDVRLALACAASACDGLNRVCNVDGYVGSHVILEDEIQRVWNFTLEPGEMTSMHRHDYDYSFVAVRPSQLEVYGEDGERLFDFYATGLSLRVKGDFLEPMGGVKLPWKVPRIHAARNIGPNTYHEILFESKQTTNMTSLPRTEL